MISSGNCSTLNTTAYHNQESVCTLSDILENEVDEKYYLSKETAERLLSYKDSKVS